uniref:Uncharacterized protein n=1 Tax=Arundo donax TaxID=35708 RepID=A0A0A9HU35_ARUDO
MFPTSLTEMAFKEEVRACFLNIIVAQYTAEIISRDVVILSSQDIPSIYPVNAKEPHEYLQLLATLRLPYPNDGLWNIDSLEGYLIKFT